jgi:hypothetical protein
MRSVTSNRVLPHWAIEELGQACEDFGLKITVRPLGGKYPQMEVDINCGVSLLTRFIVYMRNDWEDLLVLNEGDLWETVKERYLECINE